MTISSIHKIKDDLSNLKVVLKEYDGWMKDFESDLRLDGKTFSKANSEQAGLIAFYSELGDELNILVKELDIRCKVARMKAFEEISKSKSKSYTEKQMGYLLEGHEAYVAAYRAKLEVEERLDKCKTMVAAFIQRGYALKNMTANRSGGFHNEVMHVDE